MPFETSCALKMGRPIRSVEREDDEERRDVRSVYSWIKFERIPTAAKIINETIIKMENDERNSQNG
jgi:hypothetical protein